MHPKYSQGGAVSKAFPLIALIAVAVGAFFNSTSRWNFGTHSMSVGGRVFDPEGLQFLIGLSFSFWSGEF